jgi:hypothetical protein
MEIQRTWNMKFFVILVITGTKELKLYLELLPRKHTIASLEKKTCYTWNSARNRERIQTLPHISSWCGA